MNLARAFFKRINRVDGILLVTALFFSFSGLVTIFDFSGDNSLFYKQLIWLALSLGLCIFFSGMDFSFLRRTSVVVALYVSIILALLLILAVGSTAKGAQSRFDLGFFAVQPAEYAKLILVAFLAKYFSRRHIEIANFRHILVSGVYTFVLFALILIQPDFGSAAIIGSIWFGVVFASGISKRHLFAVLASVFLGGVFLWFAVFADYQKTRILTFFNPLADVRGAGYNAEQSLVAFGSGEIFGKGIGGGTQSRLSFLPESETDFIFSAFAEEWGFIGVIILFLTFLILIWKILAVAYTGTTNFETMFAVGVATYFLSHFFIHVGINMGLLPVTGLTFPFMSYGGSHLLTEYSAIGILMSMQNNARVAHMEEYKNEFLGAD